MASKPPDSRGFGFYAQMSQVAMEMVLPVLLGVFVDSKFGTTPWVMIAGALVGLFGGLFHLIVLVSRHDGDRPSPPKRDAS